MSLNGHTSMQPQVNIGSRGTVEAAAQRSTVPTRQSLNGAAAHRPAMDKRLALLRQAMGEPSPPQFPAAPVARAAAPPLRTASAASSLHRLGLVGAACLVGVAGVLWFLLHSSRATSLDLAAASDIQAPVAAVAAAVIPPPPAVQIPVRSDEDDVQALVENWRQAWSRSDVNAYLGHYSAQFVPVNGQAQAQWAANRRKIISGRSDIQVTTRELRIERIDDRTMEAAFLQDYAAGAYRETAQPKTLRFQREDSGWRIVSEQASPTHPASTP
jgi:ketosteroid isomerase-like protein